MGEPIPFADLEKPSTPMLAHEGQGSPRLAVKGLLPWFGVLRWGLGPTRKAKQRLWAGSCSGSHEAERLAWEL